jgi:hypothetical protein
MGERHVPRLETPRRAARRAGVRRRQERRQHVLARHRDREPVHHLVGHPDRRPGHDGQRQAVLGAHRHRPGSCGRGQPDAGRDRVPAQLGHVVAGRLDVHGADRCPGRPQQPDRCLQQATGHLGVRGGPAQPVQQLLLAENPQPQRHRPAARVVGQHDETLVQPPVGIVTPVRGPCGPVVAQRMNDVDSGHGGPPADSGAAIRLTLVSVRRPATGYPPAAASGQELLITMAPLAIRG